MAQPLSMLTIGQVALAPIGGDYHVLADLATAAWKAGGLTLDFSGVTAESADRVLPGGFTIKAGQKVMEAGTTVFRTSATATYTLALSGSTLVRGNCEVLDAHHIMDDSGGPQIAQGGFHGGLIYFPRLKLGGALLTETQFLNAFPGIDLIRD